MKASALAIVVHEMAQEETLTAEKIEAIVSRLSPEDRALWEQVAPAVIDAEALGRLTVVDYSSGGAPCAC
jgi:hypothetical protein